VDERAEISLADALLEAVLGCAPVGAEELPPAAERLLARLAARSFEPGLCDLAQLRQQPEMQVEWDAVASVTSRSSFSTSGSRFSRRLELERAASSSDRRRRGTASPAAATIPSMSSPPTTNTYAWSVTLRAPGCAAST
jgi:hypothetical protein